MDKKDAIGLLGGSIQGAADAIGITYQAVKKWPDTLTPRVADRVQAALGRMSDATKAQAKAEACHAD
jgi:hypothetical protein